MSRKEDFKKAAADYVDGEPDGAQKIVGQVGFEAGAEYGYQYAKKRLSKVLGFELDFNVAEFDDGVTTESLVDKIFKRMEE